MTSNEQSCSTSTPSRIGGKGGYAADNVHIAIQAEGGDSFAWLASQIED
jgi:hypothetical protein